MPELLGSGFEIPTRHFWLLLDRKRRGWGRKGKSVVGVLVWGEGKEEDRMGERR